MPTGKVKKTGTARSQTNKLTAATFRKNAKAKKRVKKLNNLLSKIRIPKAG